MSCRVRCVSSVSDWFHIYKHVFFPFHNTRTHGFKLAASAIHYTAHIVFVYMHNVVKNETEAYKYGNRMLSYCRMPSPLLSFAIQFHLGWLCCLFRITYKHCIYIIIIIYSLFVERIHKLTKSERRVERKRERDRENAAAARIFMYMACVLWTSNEHIYTNTYILIYVYIIIIWVFLFSFFLYLYIV